MAISELQLIIHDDDLRDVLKDALVNFNVRHVVDGSGCVHYSIDDHARVERRMEETLDSRFPVWRKFRCSLSKVDECRDFMTREGIDFVQETWSNLVYFVVAQDALIPETFTKSSAK